VALCDRLAQAGTALRFRNLEDLFYRAFRLHRVPTVMNAVPEST